MKLYKDLTAEEIRMIRERVYELRHTYELSYRDISDEVRDEFNVNLLPERIHTMDLTILRKKRREGTYSIKRKRVCFQIP